MVFKVPGSLNSKYYFPSPLQKLCIIPSPLHIMSNFKISLIAFLNVTLSAILYIFML